MPTRASLALALLLVACADPRLSSVSAGLEVSPAELDFGSVFVGHPASAHLTLRNTSRGVLAVALHTRAPFSAPAEVPLAGGEARDVDVALVATDETTVHGELVVRWNDREQVVPLHGEARLPPSCTASGPCVEVRFDAATGRCVEAPLPDDTSCTSPCLENARCVQGACTGRPLSCDDQNACTVDSCESTTGCRHDPLSCAGSNDPCLVPACDPVTGCKLVEAADGTSCGPNTCVTARVCIAGRCETRDAPQGSTCAPSTPCEREGVCVGTSCVRAPATHLQPRWQYVAPAQNSLSFEGTVDPDGNVYFAERIGPEPYTVQLVSMDRDGVERFRVPAASGCGWCGTSLMLDPPARRLFLVVGKLVQARSRTDGHLLWERDATAGVPVYHPKPDGGGELGAYHPFAIASGPLGVMISEGYELHEQYVATFDRDDGTPGWRIHRPGHAAGAGSTTSGRIHLTSAACWAPSGEMVRIEPNGSIGLAQTSIGRPVAYAGERVAWFVANGGLSVLDSSFAATPVPLPPQHGASWAMPLMTTDRLLVPTVTSAYVGGRQVRTPHVSDYDARTMQRRWTAPLPSESDYAYLMLTTSGDVLAQTSENDGGSLLVDLAPDAGVVFACPLSGTAQSPPVVVRGRATSLLWRGGHYELHSYELPGLDVELNGWSGASGGPWRDSLAR